MAGPRAATNAARRTAVPCVTRRGDHLDSPTPAQRQGSGRAGPGSSGARARASGTGARSPARRRDRYRCALRTGHRQEQRQRPERGPRSGLCGSAATKGNPRDCARRVEAQSNSALGARFAGAILTNGVLIFSFEPRSFQQIRPRPGTGGAGGACRSTNWTTPGRGDVRWGGAPGNKGRDLGLRLPPPLPSANLSGTASLANTRAHRQTRSPGARSPTTSSTASSRSGGCGADNPAGGAPRGVVVVVR